MLVHSAGFDYFTPEAGKHSTMLCVACTAEMDVKRNVARTMGRYGIAMPEHLVRQEDIFTCPNSEHGWHRQIIRLLQEVRDTPSRKLADLMELEIAEIRQTKTTTKEPLW